MPDVLPNPLPNVFVVDDDVSVHASVAGLLQNEALRVTGFRNAREFLAHSRPAAPCCLVLDVGLPDLDGLELQARVAQEHAEMPVIFIANCRDIRTAVRAMKAGALEFLSKPFDASDLIRAIGNAIDRSRTTLARQAVLRALQARHESLTEREREVMALVTGGRMNKEVGGELGISEITVKAHRGRVMRKMQAPSLVHLVDMARRLGMPPLPGRRAGPSSRV